MHIVFIVLKIVFIVFLYIIILYFLINFFLFALYFFKNKIKLSDFKVTFKNFRFLKIFDFIKWVGIDFKRGKTKNELFGIWAFTGYFGQGKTLGSVMYALNAREKYLKQGRKLNIFTNFDMLDQDGKIESWQDLLNLPRDTIVIFDEIQSTFTSQKFKDFPIELLWKITQCRKQGLCIFASTPVFSRMSIQLRENTDLVVCCKNLFGLDRWFSYNFYRADVYERMLENPIKLFKNKLFTYSHVANDGDYAAYDTFQIVDRLDIEKA